MKSLAAEARNTATPAKSDGTPLRLTIVRAARAAVRSGSAATSAVSGVATQPGQTELTRTPRGAQASDWDLVSAARAPFDTPYAPLSPNARCACCDVTLMIRPQPRAAMDGPRRCPSRNGAVTFNARLTSQSASERSSSGGRRLTPAQLTKMSGSPKISQARAAARAGPGRSAKSVVMNAASPPRS
jgi:hypothetical protein